MRLDLAMTFTYSTDGSIFQTQVGLLALCFIPQLTYRLTRLFSAVSPPSIPL
jgi:hypothetical protein